MTDKRDSSKPLGKSVEEIEAETSNRVNSPVEGEAVRANEEKVVPVVANINTSGTPVAVVNPVALIEEGSGPDDGTATPSRDSSRE